MCSFHFVTIRLNIRNLKLCEWLPWIEVENFVPDAFLNRRLELGHSRHRLLVVEFLEHSANFKSW